MIPCCYENNYNQIKAAVSDFLACWGQQNKF